MFTKLEGLNQPISYCSVPEADFYYTPGYLLRISKEFSPQFKNDLIHGNLENGDKFITKLLKTAHEAEQKFLTLQKTPFEPKCLTLYLNQDCILDCTYCFSNIDHKKSKSTLSINALQAASELVAENCGKTHQPLTVVFHGGGEPTLSWRMIDTFQPYLSTLCKKHHIPLFRYMATNGIMSEKRAFWLAKSVDLVGISCDGPESIQSFQRPLRNNSKHTGSYYLERTAKILNNEKIPVQVRVTLTKDSFRRQADICKYICQNLFPESIHVEPVYFGGKASQTQLLEVNDIDDFIQSYDEARVIAQEFGVDWSISEVRLNDIHTAYCNIFRQVLQLVPGDVASSCFKYINSNQIENSKFIIGLYDPQKDVFVLDHEKIKSLQLSFSNPQKCKSCFIESQCTHNCPNYCSFAPEESNNFLCELNQKITLNNLQYWMKTLNLSKLPVYGLEIK